jgi:hydroxymethylbilane synthase
MTELVIGSRGSRLALWQAKHVGAQLQAVHPDLSIRIEIIKTSGDRLQDIALATIGGKGVFVKEIEEALLTGHIDLAVHSLKDVPTELPQGLALSAILPRENPRDALVCRKKLVTLADFPTQGRVGTGSLRRAVQLRHLIPGVTIEPIRGNVDTRLRKLKEQNLDGIVLAMAGLKRLGFSKRVDYLFSIDELTPAIGQGALALESRLEDQVTNLLLQALEHPPTRMCVEAERAFLSALGGGCQVPLGAYAQLQNGKAEFSAFVASPVDSRIVRKTLHGHPSELSDLAQSVLNYLRANGAEDMLKELP